MRVVTASNQLIALQKSLLAINQGFVTRAFGDPKPMQRRADELEKKFGAGLIPDESVRERAVRRYVLEGKIKSFGDLKNVCYGLEDPVVRGKSIFSEPRLLATVLEHVDSLKSAPRKLARCFHALMLIYFSMNVAEDATADKSSWESIRNRLNHWLPVLRGMQKRGEWIRTICEHPNLLGLHPTDRYGADLLAGNVSAFNGVCLTLGISSNSWVRKRAILSAVSNACELSDDAFAGLLDRLVTVLRENESVRAEGAAMLLNRFAVSLDSPEHISLRVLATDIFGNPLITANHPKWFAVNQVAREMVANWLKGFLIERFFELLSQDGNTDKRRPRFWLKYRGSIENMWFVLGQNAMRNSSDDFKSLRRTMGDHCLALEGALAANNAFVMKLKHIYVVEFGLTGNATYLLDQAPSSFRGVDRFLQQSQLRPPENVGRLIHKDAQNGRIKWEVKFSDELKTHGIKADSSTATVGRKGFEESNVRASPSEDFKSLVKRFCIDRGLRYDFRAPSGRMIVYADGDKSQISLKLSNWGFEFDKADNRWVRRP